MRAVVCTKDDINELMEFMRNKWSESQMISTSRAFTDYHFYDKKNKRYNIIYARNEKTGEICGFITYVNTSFYDSDVYNDFVWLINWLVEDNADGGTGIMLFMKVCSVTGCKNIGTVGQNKTAELLYEKMGFTIGCLKHYFIAAHNAEKRIMSNYTESSEKPVYNDLEQTELTELTEQEIMAIKQSGSPQKTSAYIINKYLRSPYYKYMAFGLTGEEGNKTGIAIIRLLEHNNSRCLRLIEYFGDINALKNKEYAFRKLLSVFGAEYIDMYCHGIDCGILKSAGFVKKCGNVIVPNYFEPFVNQNIEIRFAYKFENSTEAFTVYKGDGDRDFKRYIGGE